MRQTENLTKTRMELPVKSKELVFKQPIKQIVAACVAGVVLVSCGAAQTEATGEPTEQGVSVDENLLTVEVTVPASFYEDSEITQAELDADTSEKGYGTAKLNDDGSVTYKMTKIEHRKALDEMKKAVDDYIQESVDASPEVFNEITYNESLTKFTIVVSRANFENDIAAGFVSFGIGLLSGFYQVFSVGSDNVTTTIEYKDFDTGEIFETQVWPDDLQ